MSTPAPSESDLLTEMGRALNLAPKMLEALSSLAAAGGLKAATARMKPSTAERAGDVLRALHALLGDLLAEAPRAAQKTVPRHQAKRPT